MKQVDVQVKINSRTKNSIFNQLKLIIIYIYNNFKSYN